MKNNVKTAVLLAAMGALIMGIGSFFGQGGLIIGLIIAFVFVGGSYWFSDTIAIKAAHAKPVTEQEMPQYYAIVRELTEKAGMPMPRLYVSPEMQPNAFATGRNPEHAAVAATEGVLRLMDDRELEGVIAHELAHVKHRDILISSVAATIAAAIMMTARWASYAAMFGGVGGRRDREGSNPIALLATIILAPLAAALVQAAISRSREFEADAGGAKIAGTPYGLMDALRKLEGASKQIPMDANPATAHMFIIKPFSGTAILNMFSTHPPTEQRIQALMNLR